MAQLSEGYYKGQLVKWGLATIGKKNTPFLGLTFRVTERGDGGQWVPLDQAVERTAKFFLTAGAIERSSHDLEYLGMTGSPSCAMFPDELKQSILLLQCKHRHDGDKTFEDWCVPMDDHGDDTVDPSIVDAVDARWDALKRANPAPPPVPKKDVPTTPAPSVVGLLSYDDAIAECERNGISKEALLDMLKGEGRTNYLAQRDTALVRGFIAHIIEQQMSAPPAAPDEFEGEQIPF